MAPLLATLARYGTIPDHVKAVLVDTLMNQNQTNAGAGVFGNGDTEGLTGMRDDNLAGYAGFTTTNNSRKRSKLCSPWQPSRESSVLSIPTSESAR